MTNSATEVECVTHDRKTKQVIVMRKDLNMRKGKMVAQGAHAAMAFLSRQFLEEESHDLTEAEMDWLHSSFVKICVGVDSELELLRVHADAKNAGVKSALITDAGFTEFGGIPTITCCAVGPDWNDSINAVCGELKLL